jgi:endonuclease YncB( thermonuclease family)
MCALADEMRKELPNVDFRSAKPEHVLAVESNGMIRLGTINHQRRVRLLGVEATGKDLKHFVERLLDGKDVAVVVDPAQGPAAPKDFPAAYVFRLPDGLCLNLEAIAQGQARTEPKETFPYRELFLASEREAMQKGLGLWAPDVRGIDEPSAKTVAATASKPAPAHVARKRPRRAARSSTPDAHALFAQGMNQLSGRVYPPFGQPFARQVPGGMPFPQQPQFFIFGAPAVGAAPVPIPPQNPLGIPPIPMPR